MSDQQLATSSCSLIVRPPYLIAPDIRVLAVDITFGAVERIPARALVMCLGGHPASECLLDVEGTGQTHRPALAADLSSLEDRLMIERLRTLFRPSVNFRLVDRSDL